MGFKIRPAVKEWLGKVLPIVIDITLIQVHARASDNRAKIIFTQSVDSGIFMDTMMSDPKPLTIGSRTFDVRARFDAPPRVRRARWILGQLWAALFLFLPQTPKPLLQVDSCEFKLLLAKDSKALVMFELLLADNADDPMVINLGQRFAESGIEMDAGLNVANRVTTSVNTRNFSADE
jgi:hypothetical protein